jgi:hypothetical protein
VIPADHKWFARICASAVIVHALVEIDPQYPVVSADRRQQLQAVRAELEAEAPKGAPADPFAVKEDTADAGAPGGTDNRGQRARASRTRTGAAPRGRPPQAGRRTSRTQANGQPGSEA